MFCTDKITGTGESQFTLIEFPHGSNKIEISFATICTNFMTTQTLKDLRISKTVITKIIV